MYYWHTLPPPATSTADRSAREAWGIPEDPAQLCSTFTAALRRVGGRQQHRNYLQLYRESAKLSAPKLLLTHTIYIYLPGPATSTADRSAREAWGIPEDPAQLRMRSTVRAGLTCAAWVVGSNLENHDLHVYNIYIYII
jgi:hypothetical protein